MDLFRHPPRGQREPSHLKASEERRRFAHSKQVTAGWTIARYALATTSTLDIAFVIEAMQHNSSNPGGFIEKSLVPEVQRKQQNMTRSASDNMRNVEQSTTGGNHCRQRAIANKYLNGEARIGCRVLGLKRLGIRSTLPNRLARKTVSTTEQSPISSGVSIPLFAAIASEFGYANRQC